MNLPPSFFTTLQSVHFNLHSPFLKPVSYVVYTYRISPGLIPSKSLDAFPVVVQTSDFTLRLSLCYVLTSLFVDGQLCEHS